MYPSIQSKEIIQEMLNIKMAAFRAEFETNEERLKNKINNPEEKLSKGFKF